MLLVWKKGSDGDRCPKMAEDGIEFSLHFDKATDKDLAEVFPRQLKKIGVSEIDSHGRRRLLGKCETGNFDMMLTFSWGETMGPSRMDDDAAHGHPENVLLKPFQLRKNG